tara:strand:+ start:45 stop:551 length:507 start_codon:yes stop_codon:yes gene_type:complete
MSKNLEKVQDMLDGNYKSKIQVGVGDQEVEQTRKVGDKWIDSDGNEWEQKEGYRTKNTREGHHYSWDMKCSDCESLIIKPWDKDTYNADGRCYYCQIDYEAKLKTGKPIKWFAYRRLRDLRNMDAILADMEKYIFEKHEFEKDEKIFDKKVANAIANGEVEMSIKKNT